MAEHGVACSLSRAGNAWDNAVMESFFPSLKVERVATKVYRTREMPSRRVRLHREVLQLRI
jgi:putative transposase